MDRKGTIIGGAAALALLAGAGWWFLGGGDTPPAETSGEQGQAAPAGTPSFLAVTPDQIRQLGLVFATATATDSVPVGALPATIDPPPNARVAVAAILPGVVTRTFVIEGDSVRKGQALATVASRDVITLGADLERSRAQLAVASAGAARMGRLVREGIVAGARGDEARALLSQAQTDVHEKTRVLGLANASGRSGSYTLTAPIAGRVTAMTVQTGAMLDGTTAPFTIDAAGRYEANAQVPERLLAQVRPGMTVRLDTGAGAPAIEGKVIAIGATLDPATRSAALKASLPAAPGIVSGRSATLMLYGAAPAGAVSVPAEAITSLDGRDVVFLWTGKGFAIRPVRRSAQDGGKAVLTGGIRAGDRIAATGISELKALALTR